MRRVLTRRPWRCVGALRMRGGSAHARELCACAGALCMRSPALLAHAPLRGLTGEEPGLWHLIAPQTEGPATEPGSDLNASKDRKAETWCGEENPTVPGRGPAQVESASQLSGTPPSSGGSRLKRMPRSIGVPMHQGHQQWYVQHLSGQIALDH